MRASTFGVQSFPLLLYLELCLDISLAYALLLNICTIPLLDGHGACICCLWVQLCPNLLVNQAHITAASSLSAVDTKPSLSMAVSLAEAARTLIVCFLSRTRLLSCASQSRSAFSLMLTAACCCAASLSWCARCRCVVSPRASNARGVAWSAACQHYLFLKRLFVVEQCRLECLDVLVSNRNSCLHGAHVCCLSEGGRERTDE